ncbi:hypothetical protein [Streptomyces sp. NPDC048057]|uniref:hypothetical protein n=1 Tax=Streptomyces sp. NPDC048057 TaxID=3155628 RepID=UPI0034044459
MGIQERERKMHRPLRRAGLEVIPDAVPDGTMPFVFGNGPEDVCGGFSHRYETPRLVERLNEDWYDLGRVLRILLGSRALVPRLAAFSSVTDAPRRLPPPPCDPRHQTPLPHPA